MKCFSQEQCDILRRAVTFKVTTITDADYDKLRVLEDLLRESKNMTQNRGTTCEICKNAEAYIMGLCFKCAATIIQASRTMKEVSIYNNGWNAFLDEYCKNYQMEELNSMCQNIDAWLQKAKDHGASWYRFSGFKTTEQLNKLIEKEKHITETKYPLQTARFREILDEMYVTHLSKNADYSHWNINATGVVGLVTRFWDKCARIMNLSGFNIGTGEYSGSKENLVKDEKLEDTFNDAAVYAIIFRIYVEGKWGK